MCHDERDQEGRRFLGRVKKNSRILLVALAATAGVVFGAPSISCGVVIGGVAALINLAWLEQAIERTVSAEKRGSAAAAIWRWVVRYAVAGGLLYGASRISQASLLAVFVGLNVVVVAMMLEGFRFTLLSLWKRPFDA